MHARPWLSVMLCAATALVAQGQQESTEPQAPTFITGAHYVRVDLYVTRDGTLVDDHRPRPTFLPRHACSIAPALRSRCRSRF